MVKLQKYQFGKETSVVVRYPAVLENPGYTRLAICDFISSDRYRMKRETPSNFCLFLPKFFLASILLMQKFSVLCGGKIDAIASNLN